VSTFATDDSKDVETRGKLPLFLGENFLSPGTGLPVLLPFVAVYVGKRGKNGGRPVGCTSSVALEFFFTSHEVYYF
jgi:hypothetical protein